MPIKVHADLPAKKILEEENIFVMDENRAMSQDIRPLEILIMNIMPLKEDTELQLLRSLSNTPLQVNVTFLTTATYVGKHTVTQHLNKFYQKFDDIKDQNYDGMILTGAPVEQMDFEEVDYWEEFATIMEWSKTHVTSTFHICWAAQAALHYHYGVQKYQLAEKRFGVYKHRVKNRRTPLVRGFDDIFYAPHSRHTEVRKEDIEKIPGMIILAESEEAGVFLCMKDNGRQIFVLGHPEYDRVSLSNEYFRDKNKGLPIEVPLNYFPDDDPEKKPLLLWRAHANTLYSNWLNYYVYQLTPYDIRTIR